VSIAAPLYELTRFRAELQVLADSGEIPPEQIADTLEALEGDIREKAVHVAAFTRNLDVAATAIREAGKAMLARAERVEKRAEGIRAYLLFQCQANGISRIDSPQFTVSVRKNPPAVVIDDEAQLPAEYRVAPPPPPPRIDRTAISKALKDGVPVPGARLIQTERLEIRE
jgi:hypothetical protein